MVVYTGVTNSLKMVVFFRLKEVEVFQCFEARFLHVINAVPQVVAYEVFEELE